MLQQAYTTEETFTLCNKFKYLVVAILAFLHLSAFCCLPAQTWSAGLIDPSGDSFHAGESKLCIKSTFSIYGTRMAVSVSPWRVRTIMLNPLSSTHNLADHFPHESWICRLTDRGPDKRILFFFLVSNNLTPPSWMPHRKSTKTKT
jgi:hypothetical protein